MGMPGRFASCWARFGAALVGTALVALGSGAYAQDLEPRAYANTPVGLNFLLAGYAYSSGGVATDPGLPVKDANLQVHSAVLAYVRSLDVWGKSGKVDVVLPYAWLSGSAEVVGQPRWIGEVPELIVLAHDRIVHEIILQVDPGDAVRRLSNNLPQGGSICALYMDQVSVQMVVG